MVAQLRHRCILANPFDCVFLYDLAQRFGQEEASRVKTLARVTMVQLKDLVEGFFSDFIHALAVTPLIEGVSLHVTLLNSLFVRKED